MMEVYLPAEDSYLLSDEIKKYISKLKNKKIRVLDMGSGSGIQAITAINEGIDKSKIICIDKNPLAIKYLKKQKLSTLKSDLFSKLKKEKFDLITFNPPYLPENEYDKEIDTTAGKEGYEIILKFLKQAKLHLNKKGTILLLFSNLSKPEIILKEAKKQKYVFKKLIEKNVGMMETLLVYKFRLKQAT